MHVYIYIYILWLPSEKENWAAVENVGKEIPKEITMLYECILCT